MRIFAVTLALAAACLVAPGAHARKEAPVKRTIPHPNINNAALDRLGWKLSCQAYTFREMSLMETIDVLHGLGIRYIELYPGQRLSPEHPGAFDHNASPEMIAAVLAKLKSAGITPVNYGVVGLPDNEAESRKVFEFARKMGLQTIVSEPSEEALPMLDRLTREYGIMVAIHNHPKGSSHYWSPDVVLSATKGLSHRIGSCADTGHWYRSGLVPLDCLKQLRGRIVSLHFKDLSEEKRDVPWGTGVCNVDGMLQEIKGQGIHPVFSIEYESTTGDILIDNVAKCCQYFSDVATRLAS